MDATALECVAPRRNGACILAAAVLTGRRFELFGFDGAPAGGLTEEEVDADTAGVGDGRMTDASGMVEAIGMAAATGIAWTGGETTVADVTSVGFEIVAGW